MKYKKVQGYTLIELLMIMSALACLLSIVMSVYYMVKARQDIIQASTETMELVDAAKTWRGSQLSYNGISQQTLCNGKLIPASMCADGFFNPCGGQYLLSASGSDQQLLQVQITNVKKPYMLQNALQKGSLHQNSVTVSNNTVIGLFK